MATMLFVALTLDRCAYMFGALVAHGATVRKVNLMDRRACDALVNTIISHTIDATNAKIVGLFADAPHTPEDAPNDARADGDECADVRAFAAYLQSHANAPKQSARYRRRVLKYAREYAAVGACLDRNERRAVREGRMTLEGDTNALDTSAPSPASDFDGAPNAEALHA